jgi:hypothetical protein
MSEQRHDDQGPLRPQVIDLDAEEIRTEPDTSRAGDAGPADRTDAEDQPPPAAGERRGRPALWLALALLLGAILGGWLYRGVLASYFPTNEVAAMQVRLDALEASGGSLAQELAALKQEAGGAASAAGTAGQAADTALSEAKSAAAGLAQLGTRVDSTDQRIAAAETSLKSAGDDLAQLRSALSTAAPAPQPGAAPAATAADTAALAALGQRIDALEKDVASLKSAAAAPAGEDKASAGAALSQVLADLKAKVAAGAPYPDEYDRIARMVPAAAGLETVGARAAGGLPNAAGLAGELRAAIPELPRPAAPAAEDNSYFGTLMKSLSGVITIREIGETDWPATGEKAAAFAEAGDLEQAIAVIDAGEGDKPVALSQWRERAAARLQLEAALAEVSDAVLRQIAALAGGSGGTTP